MKIQLLKENAKTKFSQYYSSFNKDHFKEDLGNDLKNNSIIEIPTFYNNVKKASIKRKIWKFNPIQAFSILLTDGVRGVTKTPPIPKICHTYPAMMKLGTVIPYLKKIQKLYESRDTALEFCWQQHSFTEKQEILLYQKIQT